MKNVFSKYRNITRWCSIEKIFVQTSVLMAEVLVTNSVTLTLVLLFMLSPISRSHAASQAEKQAPKQVQKQETNDTNSRRPAAFYEKRFTINFKNAALKEALQLIAAKGELQLKAESPLDGKVTYAFKDATLEDALEKISESNGLDYKIANGSLLVSQRPEEDDESEGKKPDSESSADGMGGSVSGYSYRSVPVYYSNARDLVTPLQKNLRKSESVVANDVSNSLIIYGSESTYQAIRNFVAVFDKRPLQVLIEAQIIETSKTFSRDLGISWGDSGAATGTINQGTIGITTPGPSSANLVLRGLLGSIDGRALEAKLLAAESTGKAKLISHPKVFTLNNQKATIHSGITYNIRTLSNVSTGSGGSTGGGTGGGTGTATGGLKTVSAGLQLDVIPTIVGDDLIKLGVKVTNSTPSAAAVDGIPGINDNSADSSILVKAGQTATLAGLMKNDKSDSQAETPWFSKIPVIGWLFSSKSNRDVTNELMIFLTPHIVDPLATGSASAASQAPPSLSGEGSKAANK